MMDSKSLKKLNKDLNKIGADLGKVAAEIPDDVTRQLTIGAIDVRNTILTSMRNTPKDGETYKRGKEKHQNRRMGKPSRTPGRVTVQTMPGMWL